MGISIKSVGADLCVGPWRVPHRGVSGRTHRSAPTRWGKRSGDNGNWHGKRTFPLRGGTEPAPLQKNGSKLAHGGVRLGCGFRQPNSETEFGASVKVTPPYGCNAGSVQQRADVPKAWLPPTKFRAEIWGVSHRHRPLRPAGDEGRGSARRVVVPYGWLRRVAAIARASGAQRSVCGADGRNGLESEQRSPPKVFINLGQSLSHGCAVPAPFAQGSLSLRGTGG